MKLSAKILLVSILVFQPIVALAQIVDGGGGGGGGGGGAGDYGAYSSNGFAGGVFVEAICDLMSLLTGSLGGLLTAAAFLVALAIAVTNNFKGIAAGIMVAVGCYTVASWMSFGFGQFNCQ